MVRQLLLPGVAIAGALWLPCHLTSGWPLHEALIPRIGGLLAAFVPYLWVVLRRRTAVGGLGAVLLGALMMRVVMLPVTPTFSDDIYRYVWDGAVVRAGFEPYAHAPSSPALAEVRDPDIWPKVNNPTLRSIYPPVALLAFSAAGRLGGGVLGMKLMSVFFDLATALVVAWMLRRRGRDPAAVALYAWNPLVVAETAMSGHMDPLAWFPLMLGLALLDSRSAWTRRLASVALAVSTGTKILAGALWPFFVRRDRAALWAFPLVLGAIVTPFALEAGPTMFESLETYGRKWEANAGAYLVVETFIGAAVGTVEAVEWRRDQTARRAARITVILAFLGVLAWLWRRRASPEEAAFGAVAAFVVLSPTVHPWYVAWLTPFLPLGRGRAWMLLTATAPLSYFSLKTWLDPAVRTWGGSLWITAAVWGPFAALLAWDVWRTKRTATPEI